MASVVDICNLALAHLGDEANISAISPPDGSAQSEHCARFYPIARDELLAMHTWGFATTRTAPAALDSDSDAWAYSYSVPNGCLRIHRAMVDGSDDSEEGTGYVREGQRIYTSEEVTVLVFTQRITDPTKFDPLFVTCLSWLLASYLAGPVRKDSTGEARDKAYAQFIRKLRDATGVDANEQNNKPEHLPAHIRARG